MPATRIWRGDAPAIAQVSSATITADDVTTTYKVTINGKVISVLGSGVSVTATAAALVVALAASTVPEFLEVTWTSALGVVTGTAVTAGQAFTATSSVSGGAGTFGAFSTTTASSGPNDVSLAANWSGATLPVTGDTVVFDSNNVDATQGLAALAAVQPAAVTINASYTGKIGLPSFNGSYYEYRQQYLQFQGCSGNANVGYGAGTGSGRIKLDFQTTNLFTLNVQLTAAPADAAFGVQQALLLKGGLAGCTVSVNKGSLGIAALPSEVAVVPVLNVGYVSQVAGDATVYCGAGVTLTTVNQAGGKLTVQGAVTTLTQTAGVCTQMAGLITTATIEGTLYAQTAGTFATTINVLPGGSCDLSQDMRNRTAGTVNLYKGATWNDPFGTSFAGGPTAFKTVQCELGDVTVNVGLNHVYTPS